MKLGLWAYAETTSGIIVACMPLIPRFVQKTVRDSMFYTRITSSLRSLVSFQSRRSQARGYESASSQNLSNRWDPNGARVGTSGSDAKYKAAGSMETDLEEWELGDRGQNPHGQGIVRTINIGISRQ